MGLMTTKKRILSNLLTQEILVLAGIFLVSFLIKSIGLKHGFPLLTRPDEELIMDQVFFMTRDGYFYPGNPGTFARPNQVLYTVYYFYLNLMSYLRFGENYAARYQLYQLHFYHYGRLLIALLGSLIPLVAYQIGKLFKPRFALAAGLVFMAFPSYVLHSIFITPEIPITLFTLLVIYFTLRYLEKDEGRSLYIAAAFSAINTAEKYPGLISLGIVFSGIAIKSFGLSSVPLKDKAYQALRKMLGVVLVFILALFVVAPKLFINYSLAWSGIVLSARSTHPGVDQLNLLGKLFFYIQSFSSWSNILAVVFLIAGCIALIKWRNKSVLLLFYGALYWLLLSIPTLHWERWALPMYITPLFLIAAGMRFAWDSYRTKPITRWIVLILIALYFTHQMIYALHTPIKRSFTDTRLVAGEYCGSQGITFENTLFEGYTPLQERQDFETLFDRYETIGAEIDYIILSSDMYARYYQEPGRYVGEISVYESIRQAHRLLARFEPSENADNSFERMDDILFFVRKSLRNITFDRYRGPVIEIYQVNH